MEKIKVLVVDDEKEIADLLEIYLISDGFQVLKAYSAKEGLRILEEKKIDLVLLDVMMPDMDGIDVIQKIRTWSVAPIIVISARSDDQDKVDALDAGADDYLTKPFSVEELLARVRSTLRRLQYLMKTETSNVSVFHNGELTIDYGAGTVAVDGHEIHLMPLEYSLLCLLAQNVGKVLTYQFILDKVWVNALESDMSSLRVYMASLRKKIEKDTAHPKYIQTHIGVGYRMIKVEDSTPSGQE